MLFPKSFADGAPVQLFILGNPNNCLNNYSGILLEAENFGDNSAPEKRKVYIK